MKVSLPITAPLRRAAIVALGAALALGGCDDPFDQTQPLPDEPTAASLADFRSGGLGEATAFQLSGSRAARPSQTSDWDFVYWVTDGGAPQFRPRDMIVSGDSDAGLQRVESAFSALTEAPEDGYRTDRAVAVDSGAVYAVRSRQDQSLGLQCRRYAKLRVTSVNTDAGTVTFEHLVNPNCERRNLQPGTQGQDEQ